MIVHQHLLLPDVGQPIGDNPQGHIRGAASRRISNDLYWLVGVRPRLCISLSNVRHRHRQQPGQHIEDSELHSITSSARASTVAGISMPSTLAVLRLITSSYLVGACTGRSAGFSPLRMRSTYPAARRYWSITSGP